MITTEYNNVYADNYDEITGGEAGSYATVELLDQIFSGQSTLLDIGIGTGRIAIPLSRRGYTINGVDISLAMLKKLESKISKLQGTDGHNLKINSFLCDLSSHRYLPKYIPTVDGAYASLGSLCCIHSNASLLQMLTHVRSLVPISSYLAIEAYSPLYFAAQISSDFENTISLSGNRKAISNFSFTDEGHSVLVKTRIVSLDPIETPTSMISEQITLRSPKQYANLLERTGWQILTHDEESKEHGFYWILSKAKEIS